MKRWIASLMGSAILATTMFVGCTPSEEPAPAPKTKTPEATTPSTPAAPDADEAKAAADKAAKDAADAAKAAADAAAKAAGGATE